MRTVEFGERLLTNLLDALVAGVPGAVGAGVSAMPPDAPGDERPAVAAAVGVAAELDPPQWLSEDSLLRQALASQTLVTTADLPTAADAAGDAQAWAAVRGVVVSPGEWGGEVPVVLSVYLDTPPTREHLSAIDRHEPLVTHALGFVRYCSGETERAEQMIAMTQYRRVIEQAKGLVMGLTGSDAETAFTTLSRASQHFNVPLRNLAVALVEHVGSGTAEHPTEGVTPVTPEDAQRDVAARVWLALSSGA